MASSNRHWPSMFKSKPHQWHHDINHSSLLSGPANCHKSTFASGLGGGEERSPEPKPRWNPRPEQIRILESIFNSGMVNPPRDEIRKIRAQLQEYGQVGDANVFYWFQNRKSRSKHKQRTQTNARNQPRSNSTLNATKTTNALPPIPTTVPLTAAAAATSSSSSSSEMSTGSNRKILPLVSVGLSSMMDSPTASVNQNSYFGSNSMENLLAEQGIGLVPGLWTELMIGQGDGSGDKVGTKLQSPNPNPSPNLGGVTSNVTIATTDYVNEGAGHPDVNELLGLEGGVVGNVAPTRVMVFINGVMIEVTPGPLNVREAFGELVLIHSSGHPVLTDEWGFTIHPLQHGASYYLI